MSPVRSVTHVSGPDKGESGAGDGNRTHRQIALHQSNHADSTALTPLTHPDFGSSGLGFAPKLRPTWFEDLSIGKAMQMDRYRFHGTRCVGIVRGSVGDSGNNTLRQGKTGDAGRFKEIERLTLDEILELLKQRPRTVSHDNRAHYNALTELNRKNAEFWSRQ